MKKSANYVKGEYYFQLCDELRTITASPNMPKQVRDLLDENYHIIEDDRIEFVRFNSPKCWVWYYQNFEMKGRFVKFGVYE